MKAYMKKEIKTVMDAKLFIINLTADNKVFHFDDLADDIIDRHGNEIFSKGEAQEINKRTLEMNCIGRMVKSKSSDGVEYIDDNGDIVYGDYVNDRGNMIWNHFECQFGYSIALTKFVDLLGTFKKIKKSVPIFCNPDHDHLTQVDVENILCILNEMLDVLVWTPDHSLDERDELRNLLDKHFDITILK